MKPDLRVLPDAAEMSLRAADATVGTINDAVRVAGQCSLVLAGGNFGERSTIKLLENRPLIDDKPTAYVCRNYTCDRPVTNPELLAGQLENAARAGITSTKSREIE